MIDIFSPIPVRAQGITASLINTQIQIHQKDLFTGIFHTTEKSQSVFLFNQGNLISIYKFTDKAWVNVTKNKWDEVIAASAGDLRVTSMAGEGLRVLRLFLESDFSESKAIPDLPANELITYANNWQSGNRAALLSVHQNEASALMLFPLGETNPTDAMLLNDQQAQTGSVVANQIRAWGTRGCQVLLCGHEPRSEAWKEYALRIAFAQFIQIVLKRYGELAGQFLMTDLNEQVNEEAKNWDIALALYGSNLSNRQFFEDMDRAGKSYVTILNAMGDQMKVVIGEKVVTSIRKEAILQLELDNRILVQEYVISRLDQGMR